jgi:hypothetical protein
MRSRRINIEGNRYLIFYTFTDEPWLGAAADADAGAQLSAQPNDTNSSADARPYDADARQVSATHEADRAVVQADHVSTDEHLAARSKPFEGEGRVV